MSHVYNYSIEEVKLLQSNLHLPPKKDTIRHSFKFLKYN